jgi:ubiquitin carboxyl-terminal hydrolase 22/27/51
MCLVGEGGIVEHTFGGMLRSDVTCSSCGYTSTVHEDFLALSLDIDPTAGLPLPLLKPSPAHQPPLAK